MKRSTDVVLGIRSDIVASTTLLRVQRSSSGVCTTRNKATGRLLKQSVQHKESHPLTEASKLSVTLGTVSLYVLCLYEVNETTPAGV